MAVKAQAQITLSSVVDVKATFRYYLLQSSTLAKPNKPTVYPPPTMWDDTEPSYTSGSTNSLYFVDCTVFCDDTFSYSEVSLSSSYEAAKVAYNKAVAAQGTADQAQSDINNLEIGGRNLLLGTTDTWTDFSIGKWSWLPWFTINGVENYLHHYSEYGVKVGDYLTFAVDLNAINKNLFVRVDLVIESENGTFTKTFSGNIIPIGTSGRSSVTVQVTDEYPLVKPCIGTDGTNADTTTEQYKCFKIEKGNKATDWTPAPGDKANTEDVDNEIDAIRETITERYTSAVNTSESIILSALENYVETSNYEEFKQTLEAQLTIMADEILMNFTTTSEQITNVDGDLQAKFTELYKYISFSGGTITLGSSDSAITLTIENDKIVFKRNGAEFGSWDGDYFYTGNIYVRVNESARFGNFAFLPRSDGSLMLQKVGG